MNVNNKMNVTVNVFPTGLVLRLPIWSRPHQSKLFEDTEFWEVPDGYPPEPPTMDERDEKKGVVLTNDYISRI